MAGWTNREQRKLIEIHSGARYPMRAELAAMFPRHTLGSILSTVRHLGIRRKARQIRRLRFAHEYFAKRESEISAS